MDSDFVVQAVLRICSFLGHAWWPLPSMGRASCRRFPSSSSTAGGSAQVPDSLKGVQDNKSIDPWHVSKMLAIVLWHDVTHRGRSTHSVTSARLAARERPKPAFFFKFPGKRAARALVLWPTHYPTVIPNGYNPPKIRLLEVISRVFPSSKFQHSHIVPSVSGHSVCFTFKICQILAGTSIICQFHELFKNLIFDRFLPFGPAMRAPRSSARSCVAS